MARSPRDFLSDLAYAWPTGNPVAAVDTTPQRRNALTNDKKKRNIKETRNTEHEENTDLSVRT